MPHRPRSRSTKKAVPAELTGRLHDLPEPRIVPVPKGPRVPGAPEWPVLEQIVMFRLWVLTQPGRREETYLHQRGPLRSALVELPRRPGPAEISEWMARLVRDHGVTPGSANRYRDYLSAAYESNRKLGGAIANPCILVSPLRDPVRDNEGAPTLGGSEAAAALYERARAVLDEQEKVALGLVRYFGICRGEVLGLEPVHADFPAGFLRIWQQRKATGQKSLPLPLKTKNRKRSLPLELLPARELAELRALVKNPPLVYAGQNQYTEKVAGRYLFPWHEKQVRAFYKKLRALDVGGVIPGGHRGRPLHIWRHSFSEMADEVTGGDLGKVGDLAGHGSPWSTGKYLLGRRGRRLRDLDVVALRESLRAGHKVAAVGVPTEGQRVGPGRNEVRPKRAGSRERRWRLREWRAGRRTPP